MANNREVQDRAQEEIDRVIGRNRLPNIGDRDYLPYVKAVITEALRWHPVTPTVTPHEATEDFSYQNYVIPKGAALVSNVWYVSAFSLNGIYWARNLLKTCKGNDA